MSQPWETSVVRIFARDGDRPMGAGVLVGKRLVLTCSHVVNAVLDREVEKRPPAEALLDVDFPSLSDVRIGATLRPGRWSDPLPADENFRAGADLALLDLDPLGSLETVVQAVEFSDDWAYDNESASFGFPDKALDGDTAKGRLGSRLAGGSLIEIKSDNAAVDSIQEGYSGTALWAKRGDQWIAVGLVVRMQDDWRGRAQRATAISLAFPDEIRLAAARPRGGPARLSDLHGHMGLVDREPQVSKIKSSLKLVREKQAPCAQFFTVSCVADDLPDLLRDRFGSEKTIATAAGEAVLVDWPGPMSSSAAEVGNLRDTIANALAFDDSRAPDAAAIADRLNAGDRPRIYISVLRQRQFTARQRETPGSGPGSTSSGRARCARRPSSSSSPSSTARRRRRRAGICAACSGGAKATPPRSSPRRSRN
jgi:hypothetical protein